MSQAQGSLEVISVIFRQRGEFSFLIHISAVEKELSSHNECLVCEGTRLSEIYCWNMIRVQHKGSPVTKCNIRMLISRIGLDIVYSSL